MNVDPSPGPGPYPLKPSAALLCKLGSALIHTEEFLSPDGHEFDRIALTGLLNDPEVQEWLAGMRSTAFLPVRRRLNG